MAPNPSGNSRRRIAGDAARRRRQAEAGRDTEASSEAAEDAQSSAGAETDSTSDTVETVPANGDTSDTSRSDADSVPDRPRKSAFDLTVPPRETWWWLGALMVVMIAALVFVAYVGFGYLDERNDDQAFADNREDATSSAATAAETILSYSHQSLDEDRAAAEKTMTDDFAKEYGELYTKPYCEAFPGQEECTVEGTFPDVVKRNKQQTEAAVVDVAPMECGDECSDDKASVLLFIDQESTSDGEQQNPVGNRAVFTMVKQDGDWLVDGIRYV